MAKRGTKKATGKQVEFPPAEPVENAAISKSQRIRDYLAEHKSAKAKEIVGALGEKYGVKAADVGNVLYAKPKVKKGKPGRKSGKVATSHIAAHTSNGSTVGTFDAAILLLKSAGGLSEAKSVLDKLAEVAKLC